MNYIKFVKNKYKEKYLSKPLLSLLKEKKWREYLTAVSYLQEEKRQSDIYYAWIQDNESKLSFFDLHWYKPFFTIVTIKEKQTMNHYHGCMQAINNQSYKKYEILEIKETLSLDKVRGDYIIFLYADDLISSNALSETAAEINRSKKPDIIYSDEDVLDKEKEKRKAPFYKPDFSPDTLMSFLYMGGLLAIKKETFLLESRKNSTLSIYPRIYNLLLLAAEKNKRFAHIPMVLYHRSDNNLSIWDETEAIKEIKEEALKRRGYSGILEYVQETKTYRVKYKTEKNPLISIIIPSKDNFYMLNKCITSIRNKTFYKNYEILVIDNGSSLENKQKIRELSKKLIFQYFYEPMIFNFSKMCNRGADKARGSYLLFLNDDMEIIQSDWLDLLVGHAGLPYIGAVGAKLLYPDSDIIQHIGVTNLPIGPVHKLTQFSDRDTYYHGVNKTEFNFLAVTAACLLTQKKKFDEVGGFDENMPVSYNDVELCYKFYEHGYYNVARMDVVLFHHESISRGDDNKSRIKMERLRKEREYLYKKHPRIGKTDPFYNPNLVDRKATYEPNLIYDFETRELLNNCRVFQKNIKREWVNESIQFTVEEVTQKDGIIYLEGWVFVMNADNSVYKRDIILQDTDNEKECYRISVFTRYRDDVLEQFPHERNIALSGVVSHIPVAALRAGGKYKIGVLLKAKYSRQVLFRFSDTLLTVKEDNE